MSEIFEQEPSEASPEDGFWCYEVTDANGITLRFSFSLFDRSIQTTLMVSGREIQTVCQEGAVSLTPLSEKGNRGLRGKFQFGTETSTLEIQLVPEIKVNWSALLNEN
ncbi:Uncharacterized protein dnm_019780 [Desulfonema magnum]|uniref:Uncharacterized protein n=2 Tax=Desulfonema magnum TaxID=45655 RepID=A0A975GLL1_9BACT|nr:Uncharacterized protein dnm_019780 [Desulfonema magnum]